jgi:glycine/D-amino acid oxidase-like deaminating enzyme
MAGLRDTLAGARAHPDSYYAASAHAAPARPPLQGEAEVEVCIVGAGFTGLSAGLELAERGHRVVVLEGAKVGWGASGRNGGQIVNGLNAGLDAVEARYGRATAAFVGSVAQEGGRIIRERVARHGIACDLRTATSSPPSRRSRCARSRRGGRCGGATATTASRCSTATASAGTWRPTPTPAACSTARAATCTR